MLRPNGALPPFLAKGPRLFFGSIVASTASCGHRIPNPATAPTPPPFQNTRLQLQVLEARQRLQEWAMNPWRRLSLLLIVLLTAFWIGSSIGAITGAADEYDPIAALICVVALELAARQRRRLLQHPIDKLPLQLLDSTRIGLLYGLLLEGFKLL